MCKTDMSAPVVVGAPTGNADGAVGDTLMYDKFPLVESLGLDRVATAETMSPVVLAKIPAETTTPLTIASAADTKTSAPPLEAMPHESKPRLVVLRGEKVDMQYPIYPGKNYIGRTDEKPVDIDLENQEPVDRIWTSRQHAIITFENGALTIEDLNSLNGTFVNRTRVHPGQLRTLQVNDIIQVGTVQMRVIVG
jgi:predicted component of type VI protein secretion system